MGLGIREQHLRPGVVQDALLALTGVSGIERKPDSSSLENGENPDGHLDAAADTDRDQGA
jgi:hypothetical protein